MLNPSWDAMCRLSLFMGLAMCIVYTELRKLSESGVGGLNVRFIGNGCIVQKNVSITDGIRMYDGKSRCEDVRNYFSTKPVLRPDRISELFSFFVEPVSKAFDDNSLFFSSVG